MPTFDPNATLTTTPGYRVGHWTNLAAATGCTVVLCPPQTTGGVIVRGGAPGTANTDTLRPGLQVEEVHGIVLTGGSSFGLASIWGVMQYLEERGIGFTTRVGCVPIVAGAVIFDLGLGRADVRPGLAEGYAAAAAASDEPVPSGNLGGGTGGTVGKMAGADHLMKGGLGSAALTFGDGTVVGAIVAVNAVGDVIDPSTGQIIAGARDHATGEFLDGQRMLIESGDLGFGRAATPPAGENTTIGVIATNARLDKTGASRLAEVAHNGFARAIRPAHTQSDGDTLFALGSRRLDAPVVDLSRLAAAATDVVAEAILRAVRAATTLHTAPGLGD